MAAVKNSVSASISETASTASLRDLYDPKRCPAPNPCKCVIGTHGNHVRAINCEPNVINKGMPKDLKAFLMLGRDVYKEKRKHHPSWRADPTRDRVEKSDEQRCANCRISNALRSMRTCASCKMTCCKACAFLGARWYQDPRSFAIAGDDDGKMAVYCPSCWKTIELRDANDQLVKAEGQVVRYPSLYDRDE